MTNREKEQILPDHLALVYPNKNGDYIFSVNVVTLEPMSAYKQIVKQPSGRRHVDEAITCMKRLRKEGLDGIEF